MMINGDDKSIDRVCSQIKAFLSALSALYAIAYIEEEPHEKRPSHLHAVWGGNLMR